MSATPLLDAAWRTGALRTIDHALAQSLRRLDPATPDAVLAAAALASLAVAHGHAAFDLAAPDTLLGDGHGIPWPDAAAWRRALEVSRWVATPATGDEPAAPGHPLVLEVAPGAPALLYLRRYREYERRVADGLQRLARSASAAGGVDLVTGGPGTGKTTAIARALVALVEAARRDGRSDPRIALAAPTGRAAERMAESVRGALALLAGEGTDAGVLDALPTTGSTLHRLLGTIPDSPRFRHDADNPLPFDVVVVDEASMIDLPLMAKLLDAVPDGARLVLLGDPDQLPSVEAGDVLSAIIRVGAVRDGQADTALSLLRGGTLSGVHFHEDMADPLRDHGERLLAHWRALADAATPAEALAMASRLRLLTAVRDGPQGARTLNRRIEGMLGGAGHFHGRLLMITENSYRHRLFNGDIGICFRDGAGAVLAWFPGDSPGSPRPFHPAALPAHDSAFAMTVHKAQGSEFDEAWLLLPAHDSRVLSRELVYTGMTRARRTLHVAADAGVLATALARHAGRWSGLAWRLCRP